jgi:2-polyprenyl-6-methoxyphenol hydroxylase-like FAD-dependent oxidoreductase
MLHHRSLTGVSARVAVLLVLVLFASFSLTVSAGPSGAGRQRRRPQRGKTNDTPVIVVAGAGPASLFFAHRFLQLNSNVKVRIFERRPRPRRYSDDMKNNKDESICSAGDNAFGFGLSSKTEAILAQVLKGTVAKAIRQISLPVAGGALQMVNRREMCAELIHCLETAYGINGKGRLEICFECQVTGLHVEEEEEVEGKGSKSSASCSVTVQKDGASSVTPLRVPYSLLIAADGINSPIRTSLVQRGCLTGHRYGSLHTWKALQLPPQPNLVTDRPDVRNLLGYTTRKDRGRLVPRYKNRFVLLNFRKVQHANQPPLDATSPMELKNTLSRLLVNVTEFPPDDILQAFLDEPPGVSDYLCLNKHCVEEYRVALIGDASVGMYNLLGQGCNSAMQQANLLAESVASVYNDHYYNNKNNTCNNKENDAQEETMFVTHLSQALLTTSNITVQETKAIQDLNLVAHILRKPILNLIFLKGFMKANQSLLRKPEMSFSEILQQCRWTILVSKLFWRWERIPKSLLSRAETSSLQ